MRWFSHAPRSMGCSLHTCKKTMYIHSMGHKNMSQRLIFPSGYYSQSGLIVFKIKHRICLFITASNKVIKGSASVLRPRSAATISDSAVEWLTAPCFFLNAQNGEYVVGPLIAQKTPETLLEVDLSAAKSASVYSHVRQSADLSIIQPNIEMPMFW